MGIKANGEAEKPASNLYRALTGVFLINSAAFKNATPSQQTEALANTGGKPVLFVPSFSAYANRKAIRDKLLEGADVSVELEFNGIELTDTERQTIADVKPILERIYGLPSGYEWVEGTPTPMIMKSAQIERQGYTIGVLSAKKVWERASRFWFDGTGGISLEVSASGYNKSAQFLAASVKIGCQEIPRVDVEAIAKYYGWEPNVG